jgi:hypothetical protein
VQSLTSQRTGFHENGSDVRGEIPTKVVRGNLMKPPKIASINEAVCAMDTIHRANIVYWRENREHSRDAKAEHQRRQDQLEEVRAELAQVVSVVYDS